MPRLTGHITLRQTLPAYDNWRRFREEHRGRIRPAVIQNIPRMLPWRTPGLGLHLYRCPEDATERLVAHSCRSRMCSSCGKVAADARPQAALKEIGFAVSYIGRYTRRPVIAEARRLRYRFQSGETFRLPPEILHALRARAKTRQL